VLRCLLCDMCDEGRGYYGWMHDRRNWDLVAHRPAMALAHAQVLAEGGTLRDGPWVPWNENFVGNRRTSPRDPTAYEGDPDWWRIETAVDEPPEPDVFDWSYDDTEEDWKR